MSRGPGRIERAVAAAFEAEGDRAFTTDELCTLAYTGLNRVEKKHRVAVIRSAANVCAKMPEWTAARSEAANSPLIWYNRYSLASYAMMQVRKAYPGKSVEAARQMISPAGRFHSAIGEGGSWWRHVQLAIARRDGDTSERIKQLEELQAEDLRLLSRMMSQPFG